MHVCGIDNAHLSGCCGRVFGVMVTLEGVSLVGVGCLEGVFGWKGEVLPRVYDRKWVVGRW